MRCQRCNSNDRVQEHHVWPKFMDNPHGHSYKQGIVSRVNLCWDCHQVILHTEIILNILNKYSRTLKQYQSQFYIWKNLICEIDKPQVIKETVEETLRFIGDKKDGNSISEI